MKHVLGTLALCAASAVSADNAEGQLLVSGRPTLALPVVVEGVATSMQWKAFYNVSQSVDAFLAEHGILGTEDTVGPQGLVHSILKGRAMMLQNDMKYAETEVLKWHYSMVNDLMRNRGFARAITAAVKPGDVVLDVGTGTGWRVAACVGAG